MPFVLDGKIDGFDRLVIYGPEVFRDLGLDVRTSNPITDIDLDGKAVITGSGERVPYDRLVIATGSKPFVPPVPGADLPGVMALLTLEDGRRLGERMKRSKNVVIIGGGPIGLETAPAFLDTGAKLTIIERVPQLMPAALDPDMAAIIQERLEKKGARVITGKGVDAINGHGAVESVSCAGETIPADLVLLSAGIRPNVNLAKKAGIETGVTGGILVDEYFRVRRSGKVLDDVLSVGDCAEVKGAVTGKPVIYAVGSVANRQAAHVGDYLVGKKKPYPPVLCPTVCVIDNLHVGSVGLTTRGCEQAGIKPVVFKARGPTRARYYPGGKTVDIKLFADASASADGAPANSGRLVGGQVIGEEGVHGRINLLSLAIGKQMTPADLAAAETCYAPPVAPMIDPLTYAAEMLALKCARASANDGRSESEKSK
jgi:NADH oxidase (H2O2-forming)